eukprot:CAMPEP_0181360142 /NCGR_PEP_ID=MMETSP1106-20121128/6494_1 /TAXON_ID=81844 /ORGANISM="Mantoniella antarctica, Strain SL-175" /LENGTH=807 /DNA_ID=CAMNT_0023473367 /DNA_START=244 /DNA_END=2667 /DNA_ORIENTATION=+
MLGRGSRFTTLAAAVLLLVCAEIPARVSTAAAEAIVPAPLLEADGGHSRSSVPEPKTHATAFGSGGSTGHAATRVQDALLLLPAANAADLASGAADHIVRAAFLGKDAPGALLVRGVPGYVAARRAALSSLAACARTDGNPMRRAAEWDENHGGGTFTRATVAASASVRLPPALDAACGPALRPALEALRAAADAAASSALPRLDHLLGYDTGGFFAAAAASEGSLDHFHVYQPTGRMPTHDVTPPSSTSSSGAGHGSKGDRGGDNTEGSVAAAAEDDDASPGLRGKGEHTDVGVAIVMTPALLVSHEAEEEEEQDAFGSRGLTLGGRSPELPPDSLVVMLGEAARAWLPPPPAPKPSGPFVAAPATLPPPLIAVPSHEMSLSLRALAGAGAGASRAWFGRMVLPPPSAVHPTHSGGITFGAWHAGVNEAFSTSGGADAAEAAGRAKAEAAAVSCSPRRILADDASCGAGKIYCWLSCMDAPVPACGAGTDLKCQQRSTGLVWPDDMGATSHCFDCEPTCAAAPSPPPPLAPNATAPPPSVARRAGGSTNSFCNDKILPVSMYMDGFLGWADPNAPCVAFLYRDFPITSGGSMIGAMFFTMLVGISVEGLAAARRWRFTTQDAALADAIKRGAPGPFAGSAAAALIKFQTLSMYAVQCSAGYLLMLISMTYHAVLFAGVVAGLVIGHAVFNMSAPMAAGGGASACCQHVATVPGGRSRGGRGNEGRGGGGDDDDDASMDLATGLMRDGRGNNNRVGPKACCGGGGGDGDGGSSGETEMEEGADVSVIEIRSDDASIALSPGMVHSVV